MNSENLFNVFPKLETQRFILRRLTDDDVEEFFLMHNDEDTLKYYDIQSFNNVYEAKRTLDFMNKWYKKNKLINWGIERKVDNKLIGNLCFYNIEKIHSKVQVGYLVSRDYWRQGIAREVLSVLISFGFEKVGINRIEAQIYQENIASIFLVENLGFQKEGTLREYEFVKGKRWDVSIYSLLKGDMKNL